MIVQTFEAEAESAHIRPVNLPHDLTELADLIEIAFGDELVMSDSHMVQDMRQAALLGGLVWMASGARLSGFVWEQDKRIVGNITLSQDPHAWSHWFISNVAVLPEYRRRGIGSRLVRHAEKQLHRLNCPKINLQILQGNEAVVEFYRKLGYQTEQRTSMGKQIAKNMMTVHSDNVLFLTPRPQDPEG